MNRKTGSSDPAPHRRSVLRGLLGVGFGALTGSSIAGCSVETAGPPGNHLDSTSPPGSTEATRIPGVPQPTSPPLISDSATAGFLERPQGLVQIASAGRAYALDGGRLTRYQKLSGSGGFEFTWEESDSAEVGWNYEQLVSLGFGVLIGRTPTGDLHWHRDLSIGLNKMTWSESGGVQIASGWQLAHLVALHSGHLLAIDAGGETWWHQWLGDRWHPASGSLMVTDDFDVDLACGSGGGLYAVRSGQLEHHQVEIPGFVAPDTQPNVRIRTATYELEGEPVAITSSGNGVAYFDLTQSGAVPTWVRWSHDPQANSDTEAELPFPSGAVVATDTSVLLHELPTQRDESTAPIDGYWQWQSVPAGTDALLALSGEEPLVSLVHLGTGTEVIAPGTFLVRNEGQRPNAWRDGCDWPGGFLSLPADLESDVYAAKVEVSGDVLWVPLVVRPAHVATAGLAVLANTNTWNAYNATQGISQYTNPFASQLSFRRPNRSLDPWAVLDEDFEGPHHHLVAGEVEMLEWLHREGIGYDAYSDLDLHDGELDLDQYKALLIHSHPEYWTAEMFDTVASWLERGGVVINLGGNCVYERVAYTADRTAMILRSGDPEGIRDLLRFSGRPERSLLGAAFEGVLNDNDPPASQKGSAAGVFAPYRVLDGEHRFFAGTGLGNGDLFVTEDGVSGGAGWELDTSYFDGHEASAGPAPDGLQLLARGILGERSGEEGKWTSDYNAHMTYYDHRGGGWVFSAGSLVFTHWMVRDPQATQLIRNVFASALG